MKDEINIATTNNSNERKVKVTDRLLNYEELDYECHEIENHPVRYLGNDDNADTDNNSRRMIIFSETTNID